MTEFFIPAEFDFGQQFERVTLQRAMALEPERAVLAMRTDGPTLLTRMQGSGASAYEQRIELPVDRRLGLRVQGHCSCPMGFNCKHVAAALMAFEAHQIRQQKNRAAGLAVAPVVSVSTKKRRSPAPMAAGPPAAAPELPRPLLAWLAELAAVPEATAPAAATATELPKPPLKQLMYVLSAQGTQLQLRIHLGSLRRTGELGTHHAHSPSVADMLRNQPSYLAETDLAVLAALLPLAMPAAQDDLRCDRRAARVDGQRPGLAAEAPGRCARITARPAGAVD
jgi:hypothetical protein